MAAMAGTMRLGGFIGPAVGTVVAQAFGFIVAFILLSAVVGGAVLLVLIFSRNVRPEPQPQNALPLSIKEIVSDNVRNLSTGGAASIGLQLMRSGRILLIPMLGHFLGLNITAIGLIISLSAILDAAMFAPAGMIMDRYGRKWASVPCLLLFAASLALLPLAQGRKAFLGIWRFVGDIGHAGGPVMIGALIKFTTFGLAATATAGIGLVSAAVMFWLVDETLRRE
jgi:MFS family permease